MRKLTWILSRLKKLFYTSKRFLKDHPDLLITKVVKGNVTVAMSRNQYNSKMNNLLVLDDPAVYKVINRDPSIRFQKKNNELDKELYRKGFNNDATKKNLMNNHCIPPSSFSLPTKSP